MRAGSPASLAPCRRSRAQVKFGEVHKVVGNLPALGKWSLDEAPTMEWSDGHVWTLALDVPVGQPVEFKVRRGGRLGIWAAARQGCLGQLCWGQCDDRPANAAAAPARSASR
jgi:hypothetical protein